MGKEPPPRGRPAGQSRQQPPAQPQPPGAQPGRPVVRSGTLKAPITATGSAVGIERWRKKGQAASEPPKRDFKMIAPPLTLAACAAMVTVALIGRPWAVVPIGLGFIVFGQSLLGRGAEQRRERVMRWALGVAIVMYVGGLVVANRLGNKLGVTEPRWGGSDAAKVAAPAEGE